MNEVSLTLNSSCAMLLAGPNGAGKSTLINILLGLYLPDGGEIHVDGLRLPIDNKLKARMGYLPESVAFSENLSGWAMMSFFAHARGIGRKRMHEVMELIGLSQASRRAISGYSKGMRQRLALGISVLHEPEVLILDEPTSGLDQEGLGVLWSLLDEWREKGRLILISSHDLGILEKRVDKFCILRAGSVVACDEPPALRRQASLPVKVRFTLKEDYSRQTDFIEGLRDHFPTLQIVQDGCSVRIEMEPERIVDLMASAFSNGHPLIESMRVTEPEMENIYEHLLMSA